MATKPTNNPVPSEAYNDLRFNAGVLDEFLNSQGDTFIDRAGKTKKTLKLISDGSATREELNETLESAQSAMEGAAQAQQKSESSSTEAAASASSAANAKAAAELASQQAQSYVTASIIGSSRNAQCIITSASSTATFTADEAIVGVSLNGAHYRVPSVSKTINLTTNGAGGMDSGSAPAAGYVAIYLIYNPTNATSSMIAVTLSSANVPEIYGGSNMPPGFTASCLVGIWRTSGGQFVPGRISGRRFASTRQTLVNAASTQVTTLTSISAASFIPPGAKFAFGSARVLTTTAGAETAWQISPDAAGTDFDYNVSATTIGKNWRIPIYTPQTLFHMATVGSGTMTYNLYIHGYEF